ncbi:MAG: protein TolR [Gammaproteobacteria bacterium]
MRRARTRRRLMAEINVVPYIDVMLVLLVIFMVTAPMFNQGVEVELPQATANPIARSEGEPLILTVDEQGLYYLNVGEKPDQAVDAQTLSIRVQAVLSYRKDTPVLVRGAETVSYGQVVTAMALLQNAGAPKVGLMTREPEGTDR